MGSIDGMNSFPELIGNEKGKKKNKYGILNVELQKSDNVITKHMWRYIYFDGEKLRYLSSYDLVALRHSVESKGYDWIVTDIDLARKSYNLNRELMAEYEAKKEEKERMKDDGYVFNHKVSQSGVQYVYLNKNNNKRYWIYRNNRLDRTYTRKYLSDLHDLIMKLGYDWIVRDMDVYNKVLMEEKELERIEKKEKAKRERAKKKKEKERIRKKRKSKTNNKK